MGCHCANNTTQDHKEITQPVDKLNTKKNGNDALISVDRLEPEVPFSHDFSKMNQSVNSKSIFTSNFQQGYNERALEIINKIRGDPVSYADVIENEMKYIIVEEDKKQEFNGEERKKIIFKKKVKVALTRGEPAFIEAAQILRTMHPMEPLEVKEELKIPLPETEGEIKDSSFLRERVREMQPRNKINLFYKDLIKDPDVGILLMIVDDSLKNDGKKRRAVLNPNYKFIGINSRFVKKTFVAYFAFSD